MRALASLAKHVKVNSWTPKAVSYYHGALKGIQADDLTATAAGTAKRLNDIPEGWEHPTEDVEDLKARYI